MCGILGVGRLSQGGMFECNVKTFYDLLIAGQVRGMDATGILKIKSDLTSEFKKIRGTPIDLLRINDVYKWMSKAAQANDRILLGHNRYATTANTKNLHAHPFRHGNIVLVHNGTILNVDKLLPKRKFEVDSDGLTAAINELGVEETLLKAQGAMSIVFYDARDTTLNFYRNPARPMFISYNKHNKEILFGSEKLMLEWASERNHMTAMPTPEELPPYIWAKWNADTGERLEDKKVDPFDQWRTKASSLPAVPLMEDTGDDMFNVVAGDLSTEPAATELEQYVAPEPVRPAQPVATVYSVSRQPGVERPDQMFGYKRNDPIQWVAVEKYKSSQTQDQWRIVGCIADDRADAALANVEVRCFVKSEAEALKLLDAHIITATVRMLEKPRPPRTGTAVIFVSDPQPSWGEDPPPTTPTTTDIVPVSKIVDMKGSPYDPNPPAPAQKSMIQSIISAVSGNHTKH